MENKKVKSISGEEPQIKINGFKVELGAKGVLYIEKGENFPFSIGLGKGFLRTHDPRWIEVTESKYGLFGVLGCEIIIEGDMYTPSICEWKIAF